MNSFTWEGFSCYMDVVLWVLFRRPCPFIQNHFLRPLNETPNMGCCTGGARPDLEERFMMEFRVMTREIHKKFSQDQPFTVREFRDWYQKWWENPLCNRLRQWPPFHHEETNEAHEFLQFLFSLKGMNGLRSYGMTVLERVWVGSPWTKVKEYRDKNASLIWNLPLEKVVGDVLVRTEREEMKRVFRNKEYSMVKTRLEVEELADFFVLSVERLEEDSVCLSPCPLPFMITDKREKTLELNAVIVFWGETQDGHYSAFSRKGRKWLFYDDLQTPPVRVFDEPPLDVLQKNGVLFFFYIQ